MRKTSPLLNVLTTTLITLFIIEALLRVILGIRVSPDLLLYGTPWQITSLTADWQGGISEEEYFAERHNVSFHDNVQDNYSKYHPHEKLKETNKDGVLFDVRINNHGFRGADFDREKAPGVLRVACLGDSSTFGYGDRDEETYPFYLETYLNARRAQLEDPAVKQVEVINFGVPHMLADNMYHIFMNEVLPAQPDIVTIYAGMFDAGEEVDAFDQTYARTGNTRRRLRQERRQVFVERAKGKFLTLRLLDSFVPLNNPIGLGADFWRAFERQSEAAAFLSALDKIRAESQRRGIRFYVITQQAQSNLLTEDELRRVRYDEEVALVRERLTQGPLNRYAIYFLAHDHYDRLLRAWARRHHVPLIDGKAALDAHRDQLWHWVHILPEGNKVLAETMGRRILEDF